MRRLFHIVEQSQNHPLELSNKFLLINECVLNNICEISITIFIHELSPPSLSPHIFSCCILRNMEKKICSIVDGLLGKQKRWGVDERSGKEEENVDFYWNPNEIFMRFALEYHSGGNRICQSKKGSKSKEKCQKVNLWALLNISKFRVDLHKIFWAFLASSVQLSPRRRRCLNHLWEYSRRSFCISCTFISRPSSPPWKWLHCVVVCGWLEAIALWYSIFNDSKQPPLSRPSLMNIPKENF